MYIIVSRTFRVQSSGQPHAVFPSRRRLCYFSQPQLLRRFGRLSELYDSSLLLLRNLIFTCQKVSVYLVPVSILSRSPGVGNLFLATWQT